MTTKVNLYTKHTSVPKITPQSQAIPGSAQVKNNAGGFGWAVTDWTRLERFLILGSEGGTYYTSEKKLTVDNAEAAKRCILEDGLRVVALVVDVSERGRAAKNDPALFVLAMAAASPDEKVRQAALSALEKVARTGTHLFTFLEMVQAFRGWGRAMSRAVSNWYNNKTVDNAAYQMIKYRQRNGWTHRDVLRLAHTFPSDLQRNELYGWVTSGKATEVARSVRIVDGFLRVQDAKDAKEAAALIAEYNLPREAVPTEFLKDKAVWEAMLANMPLIALIRNLGTMGSVGLLIPNHSSVQTVVGKLTNAEYLRKSRVHPLSVLIALKTYEQGHGLLGSNSWKVVPQVVDALNTAFYAAFENVEATGKRYLLGIDVSASMGSEVSGVRGLPCSVAAAAMAMVTMRTEKNYAVMAFDQGMRDVGLSASQSLSEVHKRIDSLNGGGTDCSLPMIYAMENNIAVDVFCIYTDSETWAGRMHPSQALKLYREKTGIPAKLAVFGMNSGPFSIADPNDAGMIDFVGFDASVPQALAEFAKM